jgi:peptidyl-prolyl cis-trans isomerase C
MPFARSPARTLVLLALAATLAGLSAPAKAEDKDRVLARANGVEIRQSDLAMAEDKLGASMPQMEGDQRRNYLIQYLADLIVLSQAAQKQKFGERPVVERRVDLERKSVLTEALLQDAGHAAINDAALHKAYDETVKQMPSEQEVRARQILVETKEDADAIETELKRGTDFALLAKEKSKDAAAAQGGDLGYFTRNQVPPELADVVFKLDKGQVSDPVRTQFGWHVIKLEDKRAKPTPTFDEAKPQLEDYVAHRAQAELVQKLRTAAKIDVVGAPAAAPHPAKPTKK